jgi:hypothetical protein
MTLNALLLTRLEEFGLTNEHLAQILAVCERPPGRATWHIDQRGLAKVEVTLSASMRDSRGMRSLTHLLQKERP